MRNTNNLTKVIICLNISDEGQNAAIADLLDRNFEDIAWKEG